MHPPLSPNPMTTQIHFKGRAIDAPSFEDQWRRSATALRAAGVGEGDVVALMLRNSPLAIELALAARWAGAQWCPINWHFKSDEVQYILNNSGAKVLVADADLLVGLPDLDLGSLRVWVAQDESPDHGAWAGAPDDHKTDDGRGQGQAAWPGWPQWREQHGAWTEASAPQRGAMFYTSGTTGRPKGIKRLPASAEQLQQAATVRRLCYGFRPGLRALLNAPLYHSAPNAFAMGVVIEGGSLFLEPRFDAESCLRTIERERITHAYLVPTMYVRLLALPPEVRSRYDLSSMEFVASTGSPCAPAVKRAMIDWWGPVLYESYGSSELGYMTLLTPAEALRKPGSAGRALPGVTLAILDAHGRDLPRGQTGLIYIEQPAFPDFTYVGNDAARREMECQGLKTMGDMGYLDEDGFLFIVDRSADMVISGGVNIYPVEIEHVLVGMPGVADAAVFGVPDAEFGEALHAAVQLHEGAAVDAAAVSDYLSRRVAGFKVPRQVSFHTQLPREDTGKIFKRRLREPFWQGQARRV